MTLPIISADERLKETKGIKGCIFGKSGIGKTSLLWTLPALLTIMLLRITKNVASVEY